jgi:hypothetical protein
MDKAGDLIDFAAITLVSTKTQMLARCRSSERTGECLGFLSLPAS